MASTVSLDGKRILVTGGARGLGKAFAAEAVASGARVAIADVLEEEGRAAAEELGIAFAALDLAEPQSIEACATNIADALGGLDGLVNNGAIATDVGGPTMMEVEIALWDRVMAVNVRGTWLMSRALVPHLARQLPGGPRGAPSPVPAGGAVVRQRPAGRGRTGVRSGCL